MKYTREPLLIFGLVLVLCFPVSALAEYGGRGGITGNGFIHSLKNSFHPFEITISTARHGHHHHHRDRYERERYWYWKKREQERRAREHYWKHHRHDHHCRHQGDVIYRPLYKYPGGRYHYHKPHHPHHRW